jgi:FkbM family methyltransferase
VSLRDRLMRSVRSRLARRGIYVAKIPTASRLDAALIRVLSACHVDCVLDVGAHKGRFAEFLRRDCGWEGPICSFEPVHSNFVALTRTMEQDDAWRGYEMALGSGPETTVIRHFPDAPHFDSMLASSEFGRSRFPELAAEFREETITVERLDAVIDELVPPSTGQTLFLKIDAQGFDLEVLRGATKCLHRIVAVQLELSVIAIYEGPPTFGVAIQEVMELGFDPVGFFAVARDENLRVVEFDALFVRRP